VGRKSTKYTTMAVPRLKERFVKEVVSSLKEKFQYKSVMQVPKITKIVINKGVGAAVSDKKLVDVAVEEITQIAGQRAVATISKKAISNFKLRENMPIGVKVTLRGDRMYEFLDRLTTVSLPRVRDFKGVSEKGFDGRGNYTLGVKEQIIFPEMSIDKVAKISGMDITFVTTAKTDEEAYALLVAVGMPFSNIKK
jgi:large subunit ribosomal protein L5